MVEFSFISQFFVFLISFAGLSLGFWVYFANPKDKSNQLFSLTTFFLILWAIFAYLGVSSLEVKKAIFWFRLNWMAVSLAAISGYFFIVYFPRKEKQYWILDKIVLGTWLILGILSLFTNFIIKDIGIKDGRSEIIFGEGGNIFAIISAITLLIIIGQLLKKYLKLSKEEKLKVQYFFIGLSLFVLFNIAFNVIFPVLFKTVKYQHFGDFSSIFLLGFTAYAIVKRELFGIRVILTQALVGVIGVLLLAQAVTSTNWIEFVWKFGIFLIFIYFGYLLVRSVIQEIKRRAEIQRLYEEVDKLSKAKSEFLSIASHQLRTPLTAVKGYISMIIEGTYGKLSEKLLKPLGNVYQSNERLIKLVNDLLNLSRLEAGKIEFSPELTSLEEMVSGIIEELKINAEKKGLYMKMVKTSKPLPKVMVDQDKLRQVILNIIDNAIKYTKKGGITVELKKLDSWEQIRISDTGEGITAKELKSLFQMFSRSTAGTQLHTEGAGIGLYVAKQFIEMHEGKILVESAGKGKGSMFIIKLPIHLDQKLLKEKTKTITK